MGGSYKGNSGFKLPFISGLSVHVQLRPEPRTWASSCAQSGSSSLALCSLGFPKTHRLVHKNLEFLLPSLPFLFFQSTRTGVSLRQGQRRKGSKAKSRSVSIAISLSVCPSIISLSAYLCINYLSIIYQEIERAGISPCNRFGSQKPLFLVF